MASELLLPVGNLEMAVAAIHNGADAVYFGVPGFNARGRSVDFDEAALKEMIDLCHLYGVKANLAFNVVIFENELSQVVPLIKKIVALKPDALIVQDLGLASLIRKIAPEQALHASTQMTVTNHEAMSLLEDLNFKRFVLGRENSLTEIQQISSRSQKELEVFVHGALCVSYSGQCFTSESLGGRSANRGQCAQSCRFGYEMIVDGQSKDLQGKKYLVSPQDLCGLNEIPEMVQMGVSCFKVEGRLKTPDYVATAAQSYRWAIDQTLQQRSLEHPEKTKHEQSMATSFSRGFFPGWLHGVNHQKLVDGTFSAHRGYYFGDVTGVVTDGILVKTHAEIDLENGDGILCVFNVAGRVIESGSHIYSLQRVSGGRLRIELSRDFQIFGEIVGAQVYLNHDRDLKQKTTKTWQDRQSMKRIPVSLKMHVELGQPLRVEMSDGQHRVLAESTSPFALARTAGVTDELLKEELSALSGSVFQAREIEIHRVSAQALFLSHKEIKELRRSLQERLANLRTAKRVSGADVLVDELFLLPPVASHQDPSPRLHPRLNVVLREKQQVDNFLQLAKAHQLEVRHLGVVILDFEFGRDIESSVKSLQALGFRAGVATTRILKPNEYTHLKAIVRMSPDVILVRNLGALQFLTRPENLAARIELKGDFSLNVTNHLSAEYLMQKGLSSLCASYDLNALQVKELLQNSPAGKIEVTLHQHMPSFHMEHCVFAANLSQGSSWRDCGKPCEQHKVELQDQFGNRHYLKADHECRNTMYNAKAQTALRYLKSWTDSGLSEVRYEALFETGEELLQKITSYLQVLQGQKDIDTARNELGALESYGLSEGAMARHDEYQSRKKGTENSSRRHC